MKRINLTIVLTILLVLSIPFVSFAEATIGGALIEGSGLDPRTDSRYKDNYELDTSNPIDSAISKGSPKYGDVVVSFIDYVIVRNSNGENEERPYRLKAYIRYWYDDDFDDIAKPCLLFEDDKSINGSNAIYDVLTFIMGSSQTKSPGVNMTNCYEDYTGIFNVRQIKNNTQSCYAFDYYSSKRDVEIISSDFPIFSNFDDANYYETTGIIKNAIYNPADNVIASKFTSEQIYLDDFQAIYHDAPKLDDCYIEFKYSIPKHLRNAKGSLYLDVFDTYKSSLDFLVVFEPSDDTFGRSTINVSENPYGFSIPITDFASIQQCFMDDDALGLINGAIKRQILGNELVADFDNLSFKGIGLNTIAKITKSQLFIDAQLRLGSKTLGVNGAKYSTLVDFLDLSNCYYESASYDDETETYKPNNDVIKDGYYFVDTDGNYNYHSSDGKKTSITSYDYDNSTNSTQYITNNYYQSGSGGSGDNSGEYININPVDFNQFIKGMKNMLEEFDTKGGLFLLIKDVFSMYPSDVTVIIVGAISTITMVSIICILRR